MFIYSILLGAFVSTLFAMMGSTYFNTDFVSKMRILQLNTKR